MWWFLWWRSLKPEKKSEYKQFRLKNNDTLRKIDLEGDVVFPSIKQYVQYFWTSSGGMLKDDINYKKYLRK